MFVSHWTRARLGCPVWIPGDRKRLWGGKCETAFKPCLNCSSQTVIVCTNIHSLWLLYQCHKIKSIFTWTQIPHFHWFQIFMQNLIQCPACTYFHYISQHLIWFATRYWRGPCTYVSDEKNPCILLHQLILFMVKLPSLHLNSTVSYRVCTQRLM